MSISCLDIFGSTGQEEILVLLYELSPLIGYDFDPIALK
jgi:hypothetical protein